MYTLPEINKKLIKECEMLKTDYIKGLYYGDEWHGFIDIEYIKIKLITLCIQERSLDSYSDVDQIFMKKIEDVEGLIKDNNQYIIHSYKEDCCYICQSIIKNRSAVPSFLIIIDNAFNIYEIKIIQRNYTRIK